MNFNNLIYTDLPKFENLCCIRCIFSKHQIDHEIFINVKHCQVICCRDIIKYFPTVIASPIPKTENYAYIVMTKEFYQTKRLQQYLDFKVINYTSLQSVTIKIFKLCIKYTIIYNLTPIWNKCYEYLSNGQDYKNLTDELDAVKLELTIKNEKLILRVTPLRIKVYPLSLKTVDSSEKVLQKEIVFLLPSFHKCKLLEVTKNIPKMSRFKSYDVIRDHWKHMYGIMLPRNSENINYYLVSTSQPENRIFVHPDLCLQTSLPTIIKCNNKNEIKTRFLNDLKEKVTQICGKIVSFNYYTSESQTNSLETMETSKSQNSSLVKNPCFNSTSNTTKTFNYEPKSLKNLLFQMNVNSPTKSMDSHCSSFSFQNTIQSNNIPKTEVSRIYSKKDHVLNWLLNSCNSEVSSTNSDSLNSEKDFEKLKESPIEANTIIVTDIKKPFINSIENNSNSKEELKESPIKIVTNIKKPVLRSIETVNISLPKIKRRKY